MRCPGRGHCHRRGQHRQGQDIAGRLHSVTAYIVVLQMHLSLTALEVRLDSLQLVCPLALHPVVSSFARLVAET